MSKSQGIVKTSISYLLNLVVLLRTSKLREKIPKPLRSLGYQFLPKQLLEEKMWQAEYNRILNNSKPIPTKSSVTLGIIKDFMGMYANYEAACLELGVPYKLINISDNLWIEEIQRSDCAAFLVWPSHFNAISKQMFDERLRIIVQEMKKTIFPSYNALWLYESKRRTNDWLTLNSIPHPSTWVFFKRFQAMEFLESATLPLVFKTDLGATSTGVEIIRNIKTARRLVKTCFGKGYIRKRSSWDDRCSGYILLQEYIPNAKEWRIVRIGNSFFGHQKLKKGDFHSGSKLVGWHEPPRELLDLCRKITEKGLFLSMDIDIFETTDGKYLVNELQALFGSKNPHQMYINGKPGRFIYDVDSDLWHFEEGDFCQNISCNERVKTLLELIHRPLPER